MLCTEEPINKDLLTSLLKKKEISHPLPVFHRDVFSTATTIKAACGGRKTATFYIDRDVTVQLW